MTDKKDLKRRVRERQERTHERYTEALAWVQAAKRLPIVELDDVTPLARELGLKCNVSAFPGVDARPALERLRDALRATRGDPATRELCEAVFEGRTPELDPSGLLLDGFRWLEHARRFVERARAGLGGVSGRLIAIPPVVAALWPTPPSRPALLVLRRADEGLA